MPINETTQFIAGAYSATWNGTSIGRTRDGFTINDSLHMQDVTADDFGEVAITHIGQGCSTMVELQFIEYGKVLAAMNAANAEGQPGENVGLVLTSRAQSLVLTPVAGTSAAANAGAYTFHLAMVTGDVVRKLSSKLREGPLRFYCYPDPDTSNKSYTKAGAA